MEDTKQEVEHLDEQARPDQYTASETRKVVLKLDVLILPITALMYVAASLDRGNIGNAKLQGLLTILGNNSDTRYSICLMAFYITYVVFNIPGNLLLTVISPDKAIALGALVWGIAATAQAGAQNFASVVVCRLFIGLGESSFGTAIGLYYSFWYTRDEIAKRISLYIGMGSLAGAFGGLIAYGVQFIHSDIANFRIFFLIEGLPTLLLSLVVFLFLPSYPTKSRYLKEAERDIVQAHLVDPGYDRRHSFDRTALRRCFTTRTTYLNGVVYLAVNLTLGSVSGFLPTIIASFGYTNAKAQLYTVPPYAVAFVGTIIASTLSDRCRSRGLFVVGLCLFSAIGFAILLAVPSNHAVRYFAVFPAVLAGVRLGFMNAFGQSFSILASFSFPASEGPHWCRGFGLNLAMNGVAAVAAGYLTWYYRRENARRDRLESVQAEDNGTAGKDIRADSAGGLHDLAPGFRYFV
ncbi:hypothetical protein JCM24511_03203 [Saitozyma sp. JCM 24511]|nr:hypothetical protein JCM24511_03203 [Saitozyma sp. JCM 24511]